MNDPFSRVIDFVRTETGMTLPETNYRPVRSFVEKRMLENGDTLPSYLDRVKNDPAERELFLETVTIGETYFFREEKQFTLLKQDLFPRLAQTGNRVLIWSASCSSGEEPLSLYLLARSMMKPPEGFTVYASDISEAALSRFDKGWYGPNSFRGDGSGFHQLVREASRSDKNGWRIDPAIPEAIVRFKCNLAEPLEIPGNPLFDLIFLRNTLIYFSREKRETITERLVPCLKPDGYLVVSATETPLVIHPELQLTEREGRYFFCKRGAAPQQPLKPPEPVKPQIRRTHARQKPEPVQECNEQQSIYRLINEGRTGEAEALLEQWEKSGDSGPFSLYFRGLITLSAGERDKALDWFRRCATEYPAFWPGRYQGALLLYRQKKGRLALTEFKRTMELIGKDRENGETRHHCLMDGFDLKYFTNLCDEHIKRIEKQGTLHGIE
jgi:chemotaxis protein methyltransferase CheR